MNDTQPTISTAGAPAPWTTQKPTAVLVLADGTVLRGQGFGAVGEAVGEVCFNTAMPGYPAVSYTHTKPPTNREG